MTAPSDQGPLPPFGPHLGERVTAFVDGALASDAADRALVHIAGCAECSAQVETERLLKLRLATLQQPPISAALMGRLMAMGEPGGPIPPRPQHLPGQPRSAGSPRPLATVPGRPTADRPQGSRPAGRTGSAPGVRTSARPHGSRPARRTARMAALAGAALSTMVVAVVGLSGALGSDRPPRPPVTQLTQLSQLTSTSGGSVSDPFVDVSRTLQRMSNQSARTP